jgi:hypothetical protein
MEDLKSAARLLRWAVENLVYNLSFIPEDRLEWKPEPGAKSPMEIAGEVVSGQRMMLPVFTGGEWTPQMTQMDRMVTIHGSPVWAPRAVLLPVVDAIHHHGQITYIQTLLGDGEYHFDMEAAGRFFARPE